MTLGSKGEDLVWHHYQKQGFQLLARNYIFPSGKQRGELDLIVVRHTELVFVEVKTRRSQKFGSGLDAVDFFKQRKLVHTVKQYLRHHPKYQNYQYRIDVASVDIDNQSEPVIILVNAIEDVD